MNPMEQEIHDWLLGNFPLGDLLPADLDALDAANHARDLEIEAHDGSWRDRD